ncbi:hypothetical protein HOB76_04810 [Candidatus Woesearchaeota archaeon]|nr:hypothetical protein [Candidatus Woesearchaeota archaeon]MBT4717697.1 hypothetical protein [Candidatus Woesearchaeota archaeon]
MIPTEQECYDLLGKQEMKEDLLNHTEKLFEVSLVLAEKLLSAGVQVNKGLVVAGSLLQNVGYTVEDDGFNHAKRGSVFLRKLGYGDVADVVACHVYDKEMTPTTVEQKILVAADSLVKNSKVVGLDKRFEGSKLKETKPDFFSEKLEFNKRILAEILAQAGMSEEDLIAELN